MGNGSSKDNNNNSDLCIHLNRTLTKDEFKQHLISPSNEALRSLTLDNDWSTLLVEELDCSVNALVSVPDDLAAFMPHLETLVFDFNSLSHLPDSLGNLSHLVELSLVHNKLRVFPTSLYRLSRLKKLDLSHNQLTQLHAGISELTSLQRLNLENNNLKTLPSELGRCSSLYCLLVAGNRELSFPPCVLGLTSTSVLSFLRSGQLTLETRPQFSRICDNHILEPSSPLVRYMLMETRTQHTAQSQRTPLRRCLSGSKINAVELRDKIVGLVYGGAIGSSIGLCCDLMTPDECTFHFGSRGDDLSPLNRRTHLIPRSDWSTDFEQVLLIMDSLVNWGGVIDELDFAQRLKLWSEHDNKIYNLDYVSQNVLEEEDYAEHPIESSRSYYARSYHDRRHLHNSTLVRSIIIGAVQLDSVDEVIANASRVCLSTHAHDLAVGCNRALACTVALLLQGKDCFKTIIERVEKLCLEGLELGTNDMKRYSRCFTLETENIDDYEESILISLNIVMQSLQSKKDFSSIITNLAIKGGQSANHCSLVGALMGCINGFGALPIDWYMALSPGNRTVLDSKINMFLDLYGLP